MSNRFISRKITFLSSKRGRNSNNKISLISSSKVKKKKFPKGKSIIKKIMKQMKIFFIKNHYLKIMKKINFQIFIL